MVRPWASLCLCASLANQVELPASWLKNFPHLDLGTEALELPASEVFKLFGLDFQKFPQLSKVAIHVGWELGGSPFLDEAKEEPMLIIGFEPNINTWRSALSVMTCGRLHHCDGMRYRPCHNGNCVVILPFAVGTFAGRSQPFDIGTTSFCNSLTRDRSVLTDDVIARKDFPAIARQRCRLLEASGAVFVGESSSQNGSAKQALIMRHVKKAMKFARICRSSQDNAGMFMTPTITLEMLLDHIPLSMPISGIISDANGGDMDVLLSAGKHLSRLPSVQMEVVDASGGLQRVVSSMENAGFVLDRCEVLMCAILEYDCYFSRSGTFLSQRATQTV
eukprot:TRINITY_DN40836_c0_g1_i1.p1 TRINITY_DN40836_c0_g1~~TRINITY_DN40836_c0_g1_i1.p1  ORF type:complete len:334 (-),score=34.86 TRINITY_DN40836_c0_g1_i1:78-1079(-)